MKCREVMDVDVIYTIKQISRDLHIKVHSKTRVRQYRAYRTEQNFGLNPLVLTV
jgi:hypothetical protein